jgi:hypothetical protein
MRNFGNKPSGHCGPTMKVVAVSVWRQRAKALQRRTECLARANLCCDMAGRARDAHDEQFLRGMTMVWRLLADESPGVRNAAASEASP